MEEKEVKIFQLISAGNLIVVVDGDNKMWTRPATEQEAEWKRLEGPKLQVNDFYN